MAKITEETTLAQLFVDRATLGISHLTLMADGSDRIVTATHPTLGSRLGRGATEAEAIDNAFERIRKALVESFK